MEGAFETEQVSKATDGSDCSNPLTIDETRREAPGLI